MSAGQEFWLVATGCDESDKNGMLDQLRHSPALGAETAAFPVPDGKDALVGGSFDALVKLTDDLAKADQQLDSMVHRMERLYTEVDTEAKFLIKTQRQELKLKEYLASWQWDEAKYPKQRPVADNLTHLMSIVTKLDEEVRQKTGQYNEAKSSRASVAKKDAATLVTVDLVDLLTPLKVAALPGGAEQIFVSTEHLTTVCVILPRGTAKDFVAQYESFCDMVVPGSAYHFEGMDDKDGNMLYRVVVFRSMVETFKKECRAKRFLARDFEYSRDGYNKLIQQREELGAAVERAHQRVRELCQAAWSDVMVAWTHVKAMRLYVETVLRYGMSKNIAAFIVSPKNGAVSRELLQQVLGSKAPKAGFSQAKMAEVAAEDGEEYFPYISLAFTPMAAKLN